MPFIRPWLVSLWTLLNWNPEHQAPSCDSAQDPLCSQHSSIEAYQKWASLLCTSKFMQQEICITGKVKQEITGLT